MIPLRKKMVEDYFNQQEGSITICDIDGVIVYMNEKSIATFGDKRGENLYACHPPHAVEKIKQMLTFGGSNAYTIEKKGLKKNHLSNGVEKTGWSNRWLNRIFVCHTF